jgi:hypothetical protein
MRKRTIAISLSVLAVAALAGGAYAASGSGSSPPPGPLGVSEQTIIKDAAQRLHVSPAQLSSALKEALIDQINAFAKSRHVPAAQANAIKQKLEHAPGLPLALPFLAFGGMARPMVQLHATVARVPFGAPPPLGPLAFFGPPMVLPAAAHYLGLSDQTLAQQLRSGKTLAQIATARGKSVSGLEQAIVTAFRAELTKATAAQRAAEQKLLAGLAKQVQRLVNSKGPLGPVPLGAKVQFRARAGGPPPGAMLPGLLFGLLAPHTARVYAAPAP